MKTKIILSSALIAFLTACGGGGSDSNADIPIDNVEQPEEIVIEPEDETNEEQISACDYVFENELEEPNPFITSEYCNSIGLAFIKASSAYMAGATGSGVTIAIVDTGINKEHLEFSEKNIDGVAFGGSYEDESSGMVMVDEETPFSFDQILRIDVSQRGSGYTTPPVIQITGGSVDAQFKAVLGGAWDANSDEVGGVAALGKDYHGAGYSKDNVSVSIDSSGTNGSGFTVGDILIGGDDQRGHGTFIAGLIGAKKDQNETGVASSSIQGIAYNSNLFVYQPTVFANTGYSWNAIYHAMSHLTENLEENNISVVNMSFGGAYGSGYGPIYRAGLEKGIAFIMGAGNNGLKPTPDEDGELSLLDPIYPSSLPALSDYNDFLNYDGAWVVVGAINEDKELSDFGGGYSSNMAGVNKDYFIVAPGSELVSLGISGTESIFQGHGTSYATPFVAGAFALMKEKYPQFTMKQIANIYFESAEDLGEEGVDEIYGHGLINIKAAFELAESIANSTQP